MKRCYLLVIAVLFTCTFVSQVSQVSLANLKLQNLKSIDGEIALDNAKKEINTEYGQRYIEVAAMTQYEGTQNETINGKVTPVATYKMLNYDQESCLTYYWPTHVKVWHEDGKTHFGLTGGEGEEGKVIYTEEMLAMYEQFKLRQQW